jgi:hypothetical protein
MPFFAFALLGVALLAACTPSLNWREVKVRNATLVATLPCKPDEATRLASIGPMTVNLEMTGCEASGALFAIGRAQLSPQTSAPEVAQLWRASTLQKVGAASGQEPRWATGPDIVPLITLSAEAKRPEGGLLQVQSLWFARDGSIFQAVIYGSAISSEMTEAFFSGLHRR